MKKGFIIVQIDGLSYKVLNKAIRKGYAPFLKNLIEKEHFRVNRMYCGLPAETSRTQLKIMYGVNANTPGHMWFEKGNSRFIFLYDGNDAKYVESNKLHGILHRGSSIGALFSGGAEENISLTATAGTSEPILKLFSRRKTWCWIWGCIIITILLFPIDRIISLVGNFGRGSLLGSIVTRIASEYEISLVIEESKRESPAIYVSFLSYDVASHGFGCENFWSMRALKTIDRQIKKIWGSIRKSSVNYDLFILSDHGEAKSIPIKDYFRETLKNLIGNNVDDSKIDVIDGFELKGKVILNQLEYVIRTGLKSGIQSKIFLECCKIATKKYDKIIYPTPSKESIVIMPQGDIAHIYFTVKKSKMFYEEIEKVYPKLLNTLRNHKGIRFLALSSKKGPIILKGTKKAVLDNKERLHKERFFFPAGNQDFLVASVKELIKMKDSGDIIVFGSEINGKVVNFTPSHKSVHGGIEKDEQEIFILSSPLCEIGEIKDLKELYLRYGNSKY